MLKRTGLLAMALSLGALFLPAVQAADWGRGRGGAVVEQRHGEVRNERSGYGDRMRYEGRGYGREYGYVRDRAPRYYYGNGAYGTYYYNPARSYYAPAPACGY